MTKDHAPSIKNVKTYAALRDQGYDKSKAAAIANAQSNDDMEPGKKGANSRPTRSGQKTRFTNGLRNSASMAGPI